MNPTTQDTFLEALQGKLLNQADMVSSSSTGLESKIAEAIGGVQKSGAASTAALESAGSREIAFQKEQFAQQKTGVLEAQRGFATNTAALTALDVRTEKSIRDLEQRKQELILQGESATASKISELQMKAIEFRQQAEQQSFSNLFNMGQFALNVQAENRAKSQFSQTIELQKTQQAFDQSTKYAEIALRYGLKSIPGETLGSLVARAQPIASQLQKAELAKLLKDTKETESKINATSNIWEAIRDRNLNAGAAANEAAANFQVFTGQKVTTEQFNALQKESEQIYKEWHTEKDRVKVEEEGKSFWNTFGSFFGSSNAIQAQNQARQTYSGVPTYQSPDFISNLFNK